MSNTHSTEDRAKLHLHNVRELFHLVGEICEMGQEPDVWRPHMIRRISKLLNAQIVVSSEVHFRAIGKTGIYKLYDIGWGCDQDGNTWKIHTERDERPEAYWLSVLGKTDPQSTSPQESLVPVKPARSVYGGTSFILSQYPLPHIGAVDQLGLHRAWVDKKFSREQHRLVRFLHIELGRLWKREAVEKARDPHNDLPPRLAQTLAELAAGKSEKEVSLQLGISRHTVHNYVKALHRRLGVSSRGELLAKAREEQSTFTPKMSVP